jgi:aminoglycoside phosphotransferase (APT) family kinase protein
LSLDTRSDSILPTFRRPPGHGIDEGSALSTEELLSKLSAYLRRKTGSDVAIEDCELLMGGASRAAYSMNVTCRRGDWVGVHRSVLRMDLGGKIYAASLGRYEESKVLERVRAHGVKAPRVLWASADPADLGRPFVIMERVDGETLGTRILRRPDLDRARKLLPSQMGAELARIHAADASGLDFLPRPEDGESGARAVLRRARPELDAIDEPHLALEIAWSWLWERAPAGSRQVLVHGDFRLGNLVVNEEGLAAVLDWEFTALGDPHEDLAWPFVRDWRFRKDGLRFSGLSDGADFLDAYSRASAVRPDPRALRYWEILGNFRWALGCLTQARRHLSGQEPSVELASLGRRAAEMEFEMMELMERFED